MKLLISKITIEGMKVRATLNKETVLEYESAMKAGAVLPPIITFQQGPKFFLGDGMHRILAAQKAGLVQIEAEVRKGGKNEALWFATSANQAHGLRRTRGDIWHAVEIAMRLKPEASARSIADHVGVDYKTVESVRERCGMPAPDYIIGRDGRKYKRKPVPGKKTAPAEPPELNEKPPPIKAGVVVDMVGRKVPAHLLSLWARRNETKGLLRQVHFIRNEVRRRVDDGDLLFKEVQVAAVGADLNNVYTALLRTVPYALCPSCQGQLRETCKFCQGVGFLSRFKWDVCGTKEVKDLIAKQTGQK